MGRRAMTEDDFWRVCHENDIEVFWSAKGFPFYFTVPADDLRVIALPARLSGLRLLFVQFHELAHFWRHGGDEPCIAFLGDSDRKCEAEADAIATIALMPTVDFVIEEFSDPRFIAKLREDRYQLHRLYGM